MQVQMAGVLAKGDLDTDFPAMTSNSLPAGYVASASNEFYGAAYRAFDGVDGGGTFWGANSDVCWLQIQFPTVRVVAGYTLINRDATGQAPTEWELWGSMDGSNWTVLDSQTGQTGWASNEGRSFSIAAPNAFLYYRLNITDNSANSGLAVVAELNFTFRVG